MNQFGSDSLTGHIVSISRCDRWQVYQRLQDLGVTCQCSENGQLRADVNSVVAALLVKNVVWRLTAPRLELVDWLERCWQIEH